MTEMPAETIERAAQLMRERAQAATAGPWESWIEGRDGCGGDSFIMTGGDRDLLLNFMPAEYKGRIAEWDADQDHVASWHPLVALAVADWLHQEAINAGAYANHGNWLGAPSEHALKIARAYLGETS